MYAHRLDRTSKYEVADGLDRCAVVVWVAYNSSIFVVAPSIAAGVCAALVLLFKVMTLFFAWRTPKRVIFHAAMHQAGIVGSILLLLGI